MCCIATAFLRPSSRHLRFADTQAGVGSIEVGVSVCQSRLDLRPFPPDQRANDGCQTDRPCMEAMTSDWARGADDAGDFRTSQSDILKMVRLSPGLREG
jgi:hypothetical protein